MRVGDGVDESEAALASRHSLLIDQGEYRSERGRRSRGAGYNAKGAVNGDDVVGSVEADVRETASLLCVVECVCTVWRRMFCKPVFNGGNLVVWEREDVAYP